MPNHRNHGAAALEQFVIVKNGFIPFSVKNIRAQEGRLQRIFDNLMHAVRAQREFPMRGHGIHAKRVEKIHHILAIGAQSGQRPLPCIAPVQDNRIRPFGSNGVDHSRDAVKPAHAAITLGKGREVTIGQRIIQMTALRDAIGRAEIRARQMRNLPQGRAYAQVELGLAEINRLGLRMNVSDMHQGDISCPACANQIFLCQSLLRGKFGPIAKARCAIKRSRGQRSLKEMTACDHVLSLTF